MTVISLADLVVIANHADAIDDVGQAVLEWMARAQKRRWKVPEHQLGKGDVAGARELLTILEREAAYVREHIPQVKDLPQSGRQRQQAADGHRQVIGLRVVFGVGAIARLLEGAVESALLGDHRAPGLLVVRRRPRARVDAR